MLPVIQLGPLAIQTPGLLILAGIWGGLTLAERLAPRFGLKPEFVFNGVGLAIIAGLLGARISFILLHASAFIEDPFAIFSLNPSLLDPWGGFVSAGLTLLIYVQKKGISWQNYLDGLTPFFAILLIAFPAANLASGNGYGIPTSFPWSISLWGAARHPTQVYEMIAGFGILGFIIIASRNPDARQPGRLFLYLLALSAGSRVFLEGFRADRTYVLSGYRLTQVLAWMVLFVTLVLLGFQPKADSHAEKSMANN